MLLPATAGHQRDKACSEAIRLEPDFSPQQLIPAVVILKGLNLSSLIFILEMNNQFCPSGTFVNAFLK